MNLISLESSTLFCQQTTFLIPYLRNSFAHRLLSHQFKTTSSIVPERWQLKSMPKTALLFACCIFLRNESKVVRWNTLNVQLQLDLSKSVSLLLNSRSCSASDSLRRSRSLLCAKNPQNDSSFWTGSIYKSRDLRISPKLGLRVRSWFPHITYSSQNLLGIKPLFFNKRQARKVLLAKISYVYTSCAKPDFSVNYHFCSGRPWKSADHMGQNTSKSPNILFLSGFIPRNPRFDFFQNIWIQCFRRRKFQVLR